MDRGDCAVHTHTHVDVDVDVDVSSVDLSCFRLHSEDTVPWYLPETNGRSRDRPLSLYREGQVRVEDGEGYEGGVVEARSCNY